MTYSKSSGVDLDAGAEGQCEGHVSVGVIQHDDVITVASGAAAAHPAVGDVTSGVSDLAGSHRESGASLR